MWQDQRTTPVKIDRMHYVIMLHCMSGFFWIIHAHSTVFYITGRLWGNRLVTSGFPPQRAGNAERPWCFCSGLGVLLKTGAFRLIWDAMTRPWYHCNEFGYSRLWGIPDAKTKVTYRTYLRYINGLNTSPYIFQWFLSVVRAKQSALPY